MRPEATVLPAHNENFNFAGEAGDLVTEIQEANKLLVPNLRVAATDHPQGDCMTTIRVYNEAGDLLRAYPKDKHEAGKFVNDMVQYIQIATSAIERFIR